MSLQVSFSSAHEFLRSGDTDRTTAQERAYREKASEGNFLDDWTGTWARPKSPCVFLHTNANLRDNFFLANSM